MSLEVDVSPAAAASRLIVARRAALGARCVALLVLVTGAAGARAAEGGDGRRDGQVPAGDATPLQVHSAGHEGLAAPGFELPDVSAWTLRAGELEIGPTVVRYGILDLFQIGTRFALNLFGGFNAEAKWTIHSGERFAIAAEGGLLHFDPELVGIDDTFSVWAFPVALRGSGRFGDDFRLHGSVEFLSARPDREASDAAKRVQRYLGPVGKLTLHVAGEYRLSGNFALLAEVEMPMLMHGPELRYDGEESLTDFMRGKLSLQIVYDVLNLRIGGGYGPSFLGKSNVFPVFELALRIY